MTLPRGWTDTTLGEICYVLRGVTYDKVDARSVPGAGLVPIARATNIQSGQLNRVDLVYVPESCVSDDQHLREGDMVIATSSGSKSVVGKAARAGHRHRDMAFGAFCGVVRPAELSIGDWIARVFETSEYRVFVESVAIGTNINNLRSRDLQGYGFSMPPEAEQRRIVAKLDALTARLARARAELDRVPVLAANLRRAALKHLWDFPCDAGIENLLATPIRNGLSVKGSDQPPGVPALKLSALRRSPVDLLDVRYLPIPSERADTFRLSDKDVLVSRGNGTLSLIGRAALVVDSGTSELPIFPDTAFRLRLDPSRASARWLTHVWNSPGVRVQIESVARTTAGIWKISQRDLISIRLPRVEVNRQEALANQVDAAFARADRLEAEATRARALLDRLESALLAKAFRGELVPQDPTDEPAQALLDRIRTQRAAAPKAKWGRKAKVAA